MSWLYTIFFAGLMLSADDKLPFAAGDNFTDSKIISVAAADEIERFEQTYALNATGKVSVSNVNGSIAIDTWERNEVKLEWVKTADAKENLGEVEVKIDARQDAFGVETKYLDWKRPGAGGRIYSKLTVEYRLTVPRRAVLDEIETVNGSVSIANAANVTKASAVNGEVRASNLSGTADLSTVNGTVVADFERLQTNGKISLNTVNGTVNLMIPSDANATVRADTVNGSISNDFGLPVRKGEYVGRDMHGKIGSGDVQIRLNSVNGGLSVKRKNDGKNPNPAVNLLNMKGGDGDDEDWDDSDDDSRVQPPKPPKAPKLPKTPPPPGIVVEIDDDAIRQSVEQALKEASRELARIQPQLEKEYAEGLKQISAINSEEMRAKMIEAQKKYGDAARRAGNADWSYGSPVIEEKTENFTVKGTPQVNVEAGDCSVSVRGWDKPEVRYAFTRVSNRKNQTPIDVQAEQKGSEFNIKIAEDKNTGGGYYSNDSTRTRLEIFVPQKTDLKITTGGEIRLEGVSGKIDLRGDDEMINVRDGGGQLIVASDDATVRVIGFSGDVNAKNADGTMNFEGDFQTLSAQTVDGTIILTLPENAAADIESNGKNTVGEGFTPDYKNLGNGVFLWKLGGGGKNHRLSTTEDGQIIVRNANALKSVQ